MSRSSNPLLLGKAVSMPNVYTRITYEVSSGFDGPVPGDTLETKTGRRYLVIESVRVRRNPPLHARFRLKCERLGPTDAGCGGGQWSLKWKLRSRKGGGS